MIRLLLFPTFFLFERLTVCLLTVLLFESFFFDIVSRIKKLLSTAHRLAPRNKKIGSKYERTNFEGQFFGVFKAHFNSYGLPPDRWLL